MPLYTYRCIENDHEFQVRQRMIDDPLTECAICGGPVRRVVSSVGVVFKGSGFYVTDNRSSNANSSGRKSKANETKETSDSSASSSTTTSTTTSTTSDSGSTG